MDKSLLLTGGTGVGKSVIITDYLARSAEPKDLIPIVLNFSAQTPAYDTQLLIESKLEKKRKTKFGAPPNKKIVLFVDDVNMPARETYGAQPPSSYCASFRISEGFMTARNCSGRTWRTPRSSRRARPRAGVARR